MKKRLLSIILIGALSLTSVACGNKNDSDSNGGNSNSQSQGVNNNVSLVEIHEAVKEAYGDAYYPSMQYDETQIEELFGLNSDLYDEIIAEGPMISAHADTFIAVKAKEGKVDEVESKLNEYRDNLVNDTMQYPTNKIKIQASQVVKKGNYVFFILLGEIPMEVEEQGDEAILEEAKNQTNIAVEAIEKALK